MAKYRKKPVIVDAVQFTEDMALGKEPLPDGINICGSLYSPEIGIVQYRCYIHTVTVEDVINVTIGDWIITEITGKTYPCKPEIFEIAYEPVKQGVENAD